MKVLSLHSEKYSAAGNLAAEGYRKLLGSPGIDLLQTLIREAIQNCCDASKDGKGPAVTIRLRKLSKTQSHALKRYVFSELPDSDSSRNSMEKFLKKREQWVLEICDIGTSGLTGPTHADIVDEDGSNDFVNFLRNVGAGRDTSQGGGTYGYGKSALYLSSGCSTILVDTLTTYRKKAVRRLMGCHLGEAHVVGHGKKQERRTGRHWWGKRSNDEDLVDPFEGKHAEELADAIGFLPRRASSTGTSIMMIDPVFLSKEIGGQELSQMIIECVLWNFWPRLRDEAEDKKKLQVKLELNGKPVPIPAPEDFPPLNLFCAALNKIKTGEEDVEVINCAKPKKRLGQLAIQKGVLTDRISDVSASETLLPLYSSHIAVMRPVELVVKYFEGDPLASEHVEWAGVFIADEDDEVESAFAAAEPPAHDDWQYGLLEKGRKQTFVRVAVRHIKKAAREVAGIGATSQFVSDNTESIANISSRLGVFLDGAMGQGAGATVSKKSRKKRGSSDGIKRSRLSKPEFKQLTRINDQNCAVFQVAVNSEIPIDFAVISQLVADGGGIKTESSLLPAVIKWEAEDGTHNGDGGEISLPKYSGNVEIFVEQPSEAAVTLKVSEL